MPINRTYTTRSVNGKEFRVLVAWTTRRCVVCGKFLTKQQVKFCYEHGVGTRVHEPRRCVVCGCLLSKAQRRFCSEHGIGSKEYNQYNRERNHKWNKTWRDAQKRKVSTVYVLPHEYLRFVFGCLKVTA